MRYSQKIKDTIMQKIIFKLTLEFELAEENDSVDYILEKYGITLEEGAMPVDKRRSKILVFGALAGNISDYQIAAKKMGVNLNNIVFERDYKKLKHYDIGRLKNSVEYSDIIFGPNPHKIEGIDGANSALSYMLREPDKYPRIITSIANESLKITISNFRNSISRTRYFEAI